VLFLDEPSTGLDPQTRCHVWECIGQLREKYEEAPVEAAFASYQMFAVGMKRLGACSGWMEDDESRAKSAELAIDDIEDWIRKKRDSLSERTKRWLTRLVIEAVIEILQSYLRHEYGEHYAPAGESTAAVLTEAQTAFDEDSQQWAREAERYLLDLQPGSSPVA